MTFVAHVNLHLAVIYNSHDIHYRTIQCILCLIHLLRDISKNILSADLKQPWTTRMCHGHWNVSVTSYQRKYQGSDDPERSCSPWQSQSCPGTRHHTAPQWPTQRIWHDLMEFWTDSLFRCCEKFRSPCSPCHTDLNHDVIPQSNNTVTRAFSVL